VVAVMPFPSTDSYTCALALAFFFLV
jgi:hypothetical protein